MGKKVLAVFYSQSGQLEQIIDQFTRPLTEAGATVEKLRVYPEQPYPFPWTGKSFFSVMPDCVMQVPGKLQPFSFKDTQLRPDYFGLPGLVSFPQHSFQYTDV